MATEKVPMSNISFLHQSYFPFRVNVYFSHLYYEHDYQEGLVFLYYVKHQSPCHEFCKYFGWLASLGVHIDFASEHLVKAMNHFE